MRVLFIGDIVGRPGRQCVYELLPGIKKAKAIDFVIANGENAAGGLGLTRKVACELFDNGVQLLTTGNHVWDKREIIDFIDAEKRIIRPANYPRQTTPGRGSAVCRVGDQQLAVLNLSGRVYMPALDCPFQTAVRELEALAACTPHIIVDFHAEATSEKMAMGWFLQGRVSAVIGTHTHVQTADERLLPGKTAYITDVGMTGPLNSVLGVDTGVVLDKFIKQLPVRFSVSREPLCQLSAVIVETERLTGRALAIERLTVHHEV